MIAYRYCSNKELQDLNKNKLKGYHYETNEVVSTHIYDLKKKYLHFYLDEGNMYCFDDIEPENLVQFVFPNDYDEFRGLGFYYVMNKDGNIRLRTANQLAIPDSFINREQVKNIEPLSSNDYEAKVKKLVNNGL